MKFNKIAKMSVTILTAINSIFLIFVNLFSYTLTDGTNKLVSLIKLLAQREDTISLFPEEAKGYTIFLTVIAVILVLAIIFYIQFTALELLNIEANSLGLVVNISSVLLNLIAFITLLILNKNV